ncbi:hypothetical protein BHE74_00055849 [Ensete ventricosum]|nr:hypothetical protein BHE74_00055849 [Ensete ventricosum]RZS24187.1 hypothetical protein BHM03_00057230 [Ensete ventricosum]
MGSRMSTVLRKNTMVINFVQSYARSRVSIGISPSDVVRARFVKKSDDHKL